MGKKLNKMYRESLNIIDSADAIMIFLFGLIDIIFLIFCFIKFFKTLNIKIRLLKYNLYWLLIVDDAIKIFYLKKIVILKSAFNRELIYSILTTCQFFLFLSFLEKAFNITKVFRNIKFYETLNQLHLSAIFLFAIFSYEKFIKFGKRIICPMQYIIIIICLYKLYEFLNIKISQIVDNSIKRKIILNKKITFFLLFIVHI